MWAICILGAAMNRIRGGGINDFLLEKGIIKTIGGFRNKAFHDVVFSFLFAYLISPSVGLFIGCALILFLTMWAGRSMGWGTYIQGIIDSKVLNETEIRFIDKIALSKKNHPVIRNVIALSLRGLIWSICLAAGFYACHKLGASFHNNPVSIILVGSWMGVVYLAAIRFCQKTQKIFKLAQWGFAEMVWGFVLWGSLYQIISI